MDDIVKGDYVLVLELFHQRYLADGGRWSAFFTVEVDLLQGDEFARLSVAAFEDLDGRLDWRSKEMQACGHVENTYCCIGTFAQL